MSAVPGELRVLLLPVIPPPDPWDLLVPAAGVAELVRLEAPEPPGATAPDWLCGYLQWRGLRLPLIRPLVAAGPAGGALPRAYAAICVAPSGATVPPFFAIESPGMPRLERVTPAVLAPPDPGAPLPDLGPFALAALRLRGRSAGLLDLEALERALAGAAR